jgi:peptidoglycan hydrolase-like protein with peptidoglycan-binding domain
MAARKSAKSNPKNVLWLVALGVFFGVYSLISGRNAGTATQTSSAPTSIAHAVSEPTSPPAPVLPTAPSVQEDETAIQVRALQTRLAQLGVLSDPADGVWGPKTVAALRQFERQQRPVPKGLTSAQTRPDSPVASPPQLIAPTQPSLTPSLATPDRPVQPATPTTTMTPKRASPLSSTSAPIGAWSRIASQCDKPSLKIASRTLQIDGIACGVTDAKPMGKRTVLTAQCLIKGAKVPVTLDMQIDGRTMTLSGGLGSGRLFRC